KVPAAFVLRELHNTRRAIEQRIEASASTEPVAQEDRFEAEFAEARLQLEKHEHQLARLLLQRLRNQQWDRLTPRQRYRLLVNFAASLMGEERHAEAADYLLEAKAQLPEDGEALAHEALALEIKGKRREAFELATTVSARFPTVRRAAAVLIRTAPPTAAL